MRRVTLPERNFIRKWDLSRGKYRIFTDAGCGLGEDGLGSREIMGIFGVLDQDGNGLLNLEDLQKSQQLVLDSGEITFNLFEGNRYFSSVTKDCNIN